MSNKTLLKAETHAMSGVPSRVTEKKVKSMLAAFNAVRHGVNVAMNGIGMTLTGQPQQDYARVCATATTAYRRR